METFMIKLLVLAVLAVAFALTIWLSPWFFRSDAPAAPRAEATRGAPAGPPNAEAPARPSRAR
ncbi:MAG TPA: hypothetical protein VLK28_06740 [Methylomirabilota bacterium]|nr:hypothetical protein [Methylomirabilota bacterium]